MAHDDPAEPNAPKKKRRSATIKPPEGDGAMKSAHAVERYIALAVAVWIIGLMSFLILSQRAYDPINVYFLKILLSLSIALLVATSAGFINLTFNVPGIALRAGGAIAVFIFVFTQSPAVPELGLAPPRVEMNSVGAIDFRALVDPKDPEFAESPVAITAPIDLKNVADQSRTGTLKRTYIKLKIANIDAKYLSYYFVELVPGVAGTWLSSGQPVRARPVDLKPGEVFSQEVMHLAQNGPTWAAFIAALTAAKGPVNITVGAEVDGGMLEVQCLFDPAVYIEAIASIEAQSNRLPGYVSVQCES